MPFGGAEGSLALAMLVMGLASGVHCVGMCGGIVGAFASQRTLVRVPSRAPFMRDWLPQLAFNAGRIASYAAAGAVAGALGGAGAYAAGVLPAQTAMYALANAMLILVGLYLAGAGRILARAEALGAPLWRRLQPHAARLLPARTLPGAFAAGALWGWIPCGLVYGALAAAVFAGSAAGGATAMLAFGLGTLPNLLAAGLAAAQLRRWASRAPVRIAAGALVLGFGAFGLARASGLADGVASGLLCL